MFLYEMNYSEGRVKEFTLLEEKCFLGYFPVKEGNSLVEMRSQERGLLCVLLCERWHAGQE
jgi:hypothetical protein